MNQPLIWLHSSGTPQAGQVVLPQPAQADGIAYINVSVDEAAKWRKLPRTPDNEFKRYAGTVVALYAIHHLGS